jgi:hypothetical protein
MFALITVEGIRVKARVIPKMQLIGVWKKLSEKPFLRIGAFQLSDSDFDRVIKCGKCREDEMRERLEWGRVLSVEGTDACVFNADEFAVFDYVILVRENPYHSFSEILEHELAHIARGDL